jgi:DNA invertase Pin-like site-specific DNA recombinase
MARKKQEVLLNQGWAVYLRTSTDDVQNPKNSQERQLHDIRNYLIQPSGMPELKVYAEVESGRKTNRVQYQKMLRDAEQGRFSHVAVSSTSRFGRDAAEALRAMNRLMELKIQIRFANVPSISVSDYNARALIVILFIIDETESLRIGERTRGGLHNAMRNGQFVGFAPEGYINVKERIKVPRGLSIFSHGNYIAGIKQVPEEAQLVRECFDLLFEDRKSYKEICISLHEQGYRLRSGRLFVDHNRNKVYATDALWRFYNNWFYAGWVVSEKAKIPPKTVEGIWTPLVTTEEFETGQNILQSRRQRGIRTHYRHYLLTGILHLQTNNPDKPEARMTGSTPNTNHKNPKKAIPYYVSAPNRVHIPCSTVDSQITEILQAIALNPDDIDDLRSLYKQEINELITNPQKEKKQIKKELRKIDEAEKRAYLRVVQKRMSNKVFDDLFDTWQAQRHSLQQQLAMFERRYDQIVQDVESGWQVLTQLPRLYGTLSKDEQSALLRAIFAKILVDDKGNIVKNGITLHPPFAYLQHLGSQVKKRRNKLNPNSTTPWSGATIPNIEFPQMCGSSFVSRGTPDRNGVEHDTYLFGRKSHC